MKLYTALRSFRAVVRFRRLEWRPRKRRLRRIVSVDDARKLARLRLPRGVFDYVDGGAGAETTLRSNMDIFEQFSLHPTVLRDVSRIDTSVSVHGHTLRTPLVLAPTGFTRMIHSGGELAVARAARRAGVGYSLSSMSTYSIEDVGSLGGGLRFFQLYWWRDRGLTLELLNRANESGYDALWLTVDTPVLGRRERDVRRGFSIPPSVGLTTILEGMVRPAWTLDFLSHEPILFANVASSDAAKESVHADGSSAMKVAELVMSQFDPSCSWKDLEWLRSNWSKPMYLKGITNPFDAERAVAAGVAGVVVSNHGGRQLDGVQGMLDCLEAVSQQVAGRAIVVADGGIRRGSDMVKAIALGADYCSIGRPYLYGLASAGQAGVEHIVGLLADDFHRTMGLLGCTSVSDIGREHVSRQ